MTMAVPVQEFQIGQRVRPPGDRPFFIHYIRLIHGRISYSMYGRPWYFANELTLAPKRPPYVPSERLVFFRREPVHWFSGQFPQHYRCETDTELAARHAAERAKYDAQGDSIWGGSASKIEALTPQITDIVQLAERWALARARSNTANTRLNLWIRDHCSTYNRTTPKAEIIDTVERITAAINAVLPEGWDGVLRYGSNSGDECFAESGLTLAPERPPYVPSERLVVGRRVTIARYQPELYRCETDDEMAARHAAERAEYDSQKEGE